MLINQWPPVHFGKTILNKIDRQSDRMEKILYIIYFLYLHTHTHTYIYIYISTVIIDIYIATYIS